MREKEREREEKGKKNRGIDRYIDDEEGKEE